VGRTAPASFEERFRAEADPWDFATSPYEAAKRADALAALGTRQWARGLELGCATGELTAGLAGRCRHLDAVDASPTALARAAERTAGLDGVELALGVLPEALEALGDPEQPWGLVVASEVLYYLDLPLLGTLLDGLAARTEPGATLLAVHWTGEAASHELHADEVHALLAARPELALRWGAVREGYRLDRFERT
jgi:SAM-dependent methyltransferase